MNKINMNNMVTIRIYFEYQAKAVGLTRWQELFNDSLAYQLIKICKAQNIQQVIFFNVTYGYMNQQAIQWGISDLPSPNHPQCIEVSDTSDKINSLLELLRPIIGEAQIYFIEKQELISTFKDTAESK